MLISEVLHSYQLQGHGEGKQMEESANTDPSNKKKSKTLLGILGKNPSRIADVDIKRKKNGTLLEIGQLPPTNGKSCAPCLSIFLLHRVNHLEHPPLQVVAYNKCLAVLSTMPVVAD